ncbi:MAG TPA: TPM domain-containing protein [Flavipsychrobacter sp.]|nr:TPM domain-containing protein [Flavipsychrobacter sp.]
MLFWKKRPMLDNDAQQRIVAAIKEAESSTSGEVRVFIEHNCTYMDAMHRAMEVFAKLEMHKTEKRNAVLVYLALTDRQFAIFGDADIYGKVGGQHFWDKAAESLKAHLRDNHVTEGLVSCIHELGKALSEHFPHDPGIKKNELPDEIVFGK